MLRSIQRAPRALRIITAILAIVAMICVCAASVSPAHTHLKNQADRCDVCVTAHMARHKVSVIQVAHALTLQSFLPPPSARRRFASRGVLALLTRGPPSSPVTLA